MPSGNQSSEIALHNSLAPTNVFKLLLGAPCPAELIFREWSPVMLLVHIAMLAYRYQAGMGPPE